MMQFGIEGHFYTCANVVAIKKFSELNQTQGWETGDQVLIQLAELLERSFEHSLIFRVYGDDFVVLSEDHTGIDIEKIAEQIEKLSGFNLQFSLMHYDLHNIKERHSLMEKLESVIG
jgi:GGDEF domain-containing protein